MKVRETILLFFICSNGFSINSFGQCFELPKPTIGIGKQAACIGSKFPYGVTNYSITDPVTLFWSVSDPQAAQISPAGFNQTFTWKKEGTFNVFVVAKNNCNEESEIGQLEVTVYNVSAPSQAPSQIFGPNPACAGSTHEYIVTPIEGYSSTWYVSIYGHDPTQIPSVSYVHNSSDNSINISFPNNDSNNVGGGGILYAAYNNGFCEGTMGGYFPFQWGGQKWGVYSETNPSSVSSPCLNSINTYYVDLKPGEVINSWTLSGGGEIIGISGSTSQVKWTSLGEFNLTVSKTDDCGITTEQSHIATVKGPIISANGPTTICPGAPVTLQAQHSDGMSHTYQWKRIDKITGTEYSFGSGSSIVVTLDGFYFAVSNDCSNGKSNAIEITYSSQSQPVINAEGPTTFCQGGSVILSVNTDEGLSYQWKKDGANILGATTSSYLATQSGNFSVSVSQSGFSCPQSSPISVTVNGLPTLTSGSIPSVCSGTTTSSLSYSSTTNSPNQYRIDWATLADVPWTILPSSSISISGLPTTVGTYSGTLYVRNTSTGCESTGTPISVTVNSLPTITLGSNPSVCSETTTSTLSFSSTTQSPNQYRIDWATLTDVPWTALTSSPINISGLPTEVGIHSGTLYVRNTSAGCESIGTPINVTVNSLPTITPGSIPSVCSGITTSTLPFSSTTNSPNQYRIDWVTITDVPWTTLPSSSINISGLPTTVGTYSGTLYVRNTSTGCESTGTPIDVTVNSLPTITPGSIPSVCSGTSTSTLSYSSTTNSPNQYRIDWATLADVPWTTLPSSPINISGLPTTVGAYSGTLYVRNTTTGCESTGTPISVSVNGLPTITTGSIPSVCSGTTTSTLPYSSTTNSPNQYRVDWATLTDISWTALPSSPISILGLPTNAGTYSGILFVRNPMGCESLGISISAIVMALPSAPDVETPKNYCQYSSSTPLTASGNNLLWYTTASGGTGSSTAPTPSTTNLGTTSYYVSQTINGCESQRAKIDVIINAGFNVNITGGTTFCSGSHAELFADTGGRLCSYTWSDGTNTAYNWVTTPGTYSVIATDIFTGCTATSSAVTVTMLENVNGGYVTTSSSCLDGSIKLTANPSGFYKYKWSTGATTRSITVTSPGNYNVSITSASSAEKKGCYDVFPCYYHRVAVTEEEKDKVKKSGSDTEVILFDYNSNALKNSMHAQAFSSYVNASSSENFQYFAERQTFETEFKYYPNPADHQLTVQLQEPAEFRTSIKIINATGYSIIEDFFEKNEQKKVLSTSDLASGVYLIHVEYKGFIQRRKVVVFHGN